MKKAFLSAAVAAAALYPAAAVAQEPATPVYVLQPDGSVKAQLAEVRSEVAGLRAEVAELKKLLTATSAPAPKAAACPCGDACPCAAKAAAVPAPATYPQYLVNGRWVGEAEFRAAYPAPTTGATYAAPAGYTCGPNGCYPTATVRRWGR